VSLLKTKKREGDLRAPAGVFAVSGVYGYAHPDSLGNFHMPYVHVTDGVTCVDDVESAYYNRVVDRNNAAEVDWAHGELCGLWEKSTVGAHRRP